jgi:2-polyprenyl-3-methyl-5-hydroxy-6-metoxy-1,4-benzoquinol methylase
MIKHAHARGFDARPASLEALLMANERFDLVVAFDVLEHWDKPTLVASLTQFAGLLNADGQVLARFPNGQSPFGRVHQYGDLTHQTVLSASSILQLANMTNFAVVRVGNACTVPIRRDFFSCSSIIGAGGGARASSAGSAVYGFGRWRSTRISWCCCASWTSMPSTNRTDRNAERT